MIVTMNDTHTTKPQGLREVVASIISMMLGLLRAHGLRGLIHLPTLWLVAREIRRIGERFAELFAALEAGTLHLPPPEPPIVPQQFQAARAQPSASARPAAPRRRRPRTQSAPTKARARAPRTYVSHHLRPPTPLPRPLGLVRATAARKNPFWPRCLGTSKTLRFSN